MNTLATINQYVAGTLLGILALDVLGFIMWAMSGQLPIDNFYIGTITAHTLRAIIGV